MEIWKEVKGFKDYEVSNLGRVKSLSRLVNYVDGRKTKTKERILKSGLGGRGYFTVGLSKDKKSNTKKVHQLVAIAFLDHKPDGYKLVIDHRNDVKTDNRVENLQIVTSRFNVCKTQGSYSSKYKGVCWHKQRKKWTSKIVIKGKAKYLGIFTDEKEASQAYQTALLTV